MRAGGNFRNHAAVKGLNIRRRRDFVRENFSAAYDRGGRLVARRFDAENDRGGFIEIGGRKRIHGTTFLKTLSEKRRTGERENRRTGKRENRKRENRKRGNEKRKNGRTKNGRTGERKNGRTKKRKNRRTGRKKRRRTEAERYERKNQPKESAKETIIGSTCRR